MEAFRTSDERFRNLPGYPFAPHYAEQDGLRMHYLDEGQGDPLLLLHGEPTWSFLYRTMVPELGGVARVVAPDYFGFGRSDKPTEIGDYSYDFHYESIRRLVDGLDLRDATVVVQDWGGPIGLRLAIEHPERVSRLVVLNTWVGEGWTPPETWLRFRALVRRAGPDLLASRIVRASCVNEPADEVLAAYDAPFPTAESKAGMLAFPELVPTDRDHPDAPTMREVGRALEQWERPALVLFSDSDLIFCRDVAARMAARIPGAGPAELVSGAGHFLQEEKGEQVAERIARFLVES